MCMENLITEPTDQVIAYKVLMYDGYGWCTPFVFARADQTMIAYGEYYGGESITEGAIHCFKSKEKAEEHCYCDYYPRAVFQVRGTGLVGHNAEEIGFKKIEFVEDPNEYEYCYNLKDKKIKTNEFKNV